MSLWLFVPRDPLIFRDGKPFTATPGERAKSLVFPYPSTVAGAVRTLSGIDPVTGVFDKNRIAELKEIVIRGPVLVELDEKGQIIDWLFPAPADAFLVDASHPIRYSLAPLDKLQGANYNLDKLHLVGTARMVKEKPLARTPRYWRWKQLEAWLVQQTDGPVDLDQLGIQGPAREFRTHVSITPETQTAVPGALFQTSGMEFVYVKREVVGQACPEKVCALALALETPAPLKDGLGHLGGERRVGRWQRAKAQLPGCPAEIKKVIIEQQHCRLILTTPTYFEHGDLPAWFGSDSKLQVTVEAAAIPRYQTLSGWDYELSGPKASRRLAPAGSVYFLRLQGNQAAIDGFVETVWMNSISDDKQFRNDGFGLALLGTWDGKLRTMEVN